MAGHELPGTAADALVRRLLDHRVEVVFGYPGGQLTPVYDALAREPRIRHILARDEQAAAFMADGYARATGRVGVCLAVCGPGVLNAAAPLATSYTDSIPVVLISGQVPLSGLGLRSGYYHENNQLSLCSTITKARARVESAPSIVGEVDRVFIESAHGRPGPALLEVPVDILRSEVTFESWPMIPHPPAPLGPESARIADLSKLLDGWERPVLIAGGGVLTSGACEQMLELAERLGAPVFHTLCGKSAFPADHALAAGLPWHRATSDVSAMDQFISPLFRQSDGLLAIGCRFSQAATGSWCIPKPKSMAQVDVDAAEIGRHYPVDIGVHADARVALAALLELLPSHNRRPWATIPRREPPWQLAGLDLVGPLRSALPRDAIVVADITRLAYIMLAEFPSYLPRTFLHPAGYVSMGYGIPAALGARAAHPGRAIVAVVGDGCFLMSGMELATAMQENLPIVIVVINDSSLSLIKAIQERRYQSRFLGVDLRNPDLGAFASAFGVPSWRVETDAEFAAALEKALGLQEPSLIEVMLPGLG